MEKKEYWFALYPSTFLWVKDEKGLVYNSETGMKIKFINKGAIAHVTQILLDLDALYCASISQEVLEDKKLDTWIHEVTASNAGVLLIKNGISQRPLTLMPVLKVQDKVEYYRWEHNQGIDGNIMENLHRLTFFINGSEYGNDLFSRQILYPLTGKALLNSKALCSFALNSRQSSFLSEIELVGNPFVFPNLQTVVDTLETICPVTVCVTQQDVMDNLAQAEILSKNMNLHVLVTDYVSLSLLLSNELMKRVLLTFIITSEQDYKDAIKYKEENNFEKLEILPVYTGSNRDFFEKGLFINKEELQNISLSKREIFIRQSLNVADFGNLLIMPDGKIYANSNFPSIGTIEETPHAVVYRELTEGYSWFRIRKETPCCDCIYQWLCPSPSNYELVLGKQNLCHIKD